MSFNTSGNPWMGVAVGLTNSNVSLGSGTVGASTVGANYDGPTFRDGSRAKLLPSAWSTYRFAGGKDHGGTTARLFTVSSGSKGQGFETSLGVEGTSVAVAGAFPAHTDIQGITWEVYREHPANDLQELADLVQDEPASIYESVLGLLTASSISIETANTAMYATRLMSSDFPKGKVDWRGVDRWTGGMKMPEGIVFSLPAGAHFAVRVDIFSTWRPVFPVRLRVSLDLV